MRFRTYSAPLMFRFPLGKQVARLLLACLCLSLISACGKDKGEPPPTTVADPSVTVTPVIEKTIPQYVEYVGQTEAPVSVEIRARVEGFIQEVAFAEGSEVKEGDLLFVIDPKP